VYVGVVAGTINSGSINNVKVNNSSMSINRLNSFVGGIAGYTKQPVSVYVCNYYGTIYGNGNMGGIVGYNMGLVSYCDGSATITYYSKKAQASIGGVVGWNDGSVDHCNNYAMIYSAEGQKVDAEARIGGIIGDNTNGTFDGVGNKGSWSVHWTYSNGFLGIGKYDNGKYIFKHYDQRVGKQ